MRVKKLGLILCCSVLVLLTALAVMVVVRVSLPSRASAATWSRDLSDSFARADGPIGNGWSDPANLAAIHSGVLSLGYNGASPWTSLTARPATESAVDREIGVDSAAGNTVASGNGVFAFLRAQPAAAPNQSVYWAGLYQGALYMGKVADGVRADHITLPVSPAMNGSHGYRLDFSATGTTPTTLTATITDLTSSALVATDTYTDTEPALQTAGQSGVWAVTTVATPRWRIANVTTYDLGVRAAGYTLSGPASASLDQGSSDFTVTPDGSYTGTITPTDAGAGGAFAPPSLSFTSSAAAQTFSYTPAATGTATIGTTSSPALTDPAAVSLSVIDPGNGRIGVSAGDLAWSPFTWQFNGSSWAQTGPGGAYVKIAFTGSTLGLNIDASLLGAISPASMVLTAYIDGAPRPIFKTLADAAGGQIIFTAALPAGDHYAQIYLSSTPFPSDRWLVPADDLRITSVQLAAGGMVRPLASTPLATRAERVLVFGDSITEGYTADPHQAEQAYSADVGHDLQAEYGQVGYGGAGWDIGAPSNVPDFYDSSSPANSSWRSFNGTRSRLVDAAQLNRGFVGGAPDAIYLNLGINDANNGEPAGDLRAKTAAWLTDIRTTVGPRPAVFVIIPFNLDNPNNGSYVPYKAALLHGVRDHAAVNPGDTRVFVIDLGVFGYNTVLVHSTDALHPDAAGAAILASAIVEASAADISMELQPGAISSGAPTTETGASLAVSAPTGGLPPYTYQWYRSTSATFVPGAATLVSGATGVTLDDTGLAPGTTYHYRVTSGDNTNPDQSVTSTQFSVTTVPAALAVGPGGVTPTTTSPVTPVKPPTPVSATAPPPPGVFSCPAAVFRNVTPSLSARFGPVHGGVTLKATGSTVCAVVAVHFGTRPAVFTVSGASSIQISVPRGTGTVAVTASTPHGTLRLGSFRYAASGPGIYSAVPGAGPARQHRRITLRGFGFFHIQAVYFGYQKGSNIRVLSRYVVVVTAPPGHGTVDIRLVTRQHRSSPKGAGARYSYRP